MLLETGLVPYSLSSPPGERALVLAPHPDDETFGMGGSLRLLTDAGRRVKVLVLTAGEKADAKTRDRERYSSLRVLAGALLVPYLAWVSFASVLNFVLWRLNADPTLTR